MRLLLAITFLALLCGCPGRLDDPDRFLITTCEPVCTTSTSTIPPLLTIFRPRCGIDGCHDSSAMPESGLDLYSGGVAARLVGVTSTTAVCNGRTYVVPGDPTNSLIYGKISGIPPCGIPMPVGSELSVEDIEAVRLWIEALAPM